MGLEYDGESNRPVITAETMLVIVVALCLLALFVLSAIAIRQDPTPEQVDQYEQRYEQELENNE